MTFPTGNGKEVELPLMNIRFIEADGIVSYIHLGDYDREKVAITNPLGACEKILGEYAFARIHRKYLVNYSWVKNIITGNDMSCILNDDKKLPIARRRQRTLIDQINRYQLNRLLLNKNKTKPIINL